MSGDRPPGTKSEWAYGRLRELIAEGELRPGDALRLSELARRFGVSEMPVREALRMLQRDGLVQMRSHRGAVVTDVRLDEVVQLVMARMHLEALALAEAVPHHDERSLRAAERALERMARAAARGDHRVVSEANRAFHAALEGPCPYPLLTGLIEELWDRVWHARPGSLFRLRADRSGRAVQEHRRILRAVRRGDAEAAAERFAEHTERTLAAWRALAERPAATPPDATAG